MLRKISSIAFVLMVGSVSAQAIERPNTTGYTGSATNATRLAMNHEVLRTGDRLKAVIDLPAQEMVVYIDGSRQYSFKISSGRNGYRTPSGYYKPQWLSRMHYSKKFDDAPMPYSVFFKGGYAIHGTTSISRLGAPASHGCIRLHPDNARTFFELVQRHGKSNSSIEILGQAPGVSNYEADDRLKTSVSISDKPAPKKSTGPASISNFGTIPSFF